MLFQLLDTILIVHDLWQFRDYFLLLAFENFDSLEWVLCNSSVKCVLNYKVFRFELLRLFELDS